MDRSLLRLRFEGVRGKGVGGQKIERQLAPAGRPRDHAVEELVAEAREMRRDAAFRVMHRAPEPLTRRRGWDGPPGVEPRQDLIARHRLRSFLKIVGACDRVDARRVTSRTPAEEKCGRPPPLPPAVEARAFTMSPALIPWLTRSSVT